MAFNVLLVDDSDIIRSMIARTLELADFPLGEVHEAADGRQALEILDASWIDLALVDLNMPIMDGATLLERMRAQADTANIPVIIVSTEGSSERIAEIGQHGPTAWIRKPFTPEEIRAAVLAVTDTWIPEGIDEMLDRVVTLVAEQFALAFVEPIECEAIPDPGGDLMVAQITFRGSWSGNLMLAAPAALCVELAANALGVEPQDVESHVAGADLLGEALNQACGRLATELDARHPSELSPPVVAACSRAEWDGIVSNQEGRGYLIEERPLVAALRLRRTGSA